MRIHDAYTRLDRTGGARPDIAPKPADAAPSSRTPAVTSATTVKLSAKAQELASRDSGRIEELRQQVLQGKLKIDAHAIAGKLVGDDP